MNKNAPLNTLSGCYTAGGNNVGDTIAEQLNRDCFCKTFDREKFTAILNSDELHQDLLLTHPQLFSNTAVFISPQQLHCMKAIIHAVERVVALPSYQQHALSQAPETALFDPGTAGVFMGYDFHLSPEGPKVIEINTNAGGAFLNSVLVSAQEACCRAAETVLPLVKNNMDEQFIQMFLREWRYQRNDLPLLRIAIVDDHPQQQFLYPEFKMAQRLFEQHGIVAVIAAPEELIFDNQGLHYQGQIIDLIYNRLTDFSLTEKNHKHLYKAYLTDAVVVTPNPRQHALYGDKRNLVTLSNETMLKQYGVSDTDIDILKAGIPKTQLMTTENADELWRNRKQLFFKPTSGFGGRAAYRGDKLTKRVWEDIQQSQYVAQEQILPSERGISSINAEKISLKMDIRAYVYEGEIQLLAARLYQGQTTNFRTEGGGFAPVYIAS